jgi:hypothetical protein
MTTSDNIESAKHILKLLGLPPEQQNDRSALTLLALLNLSPGREWGYAQNPLLGITPIMDWVRQHYGRSYMPNSRETFRKQTMHQFVQAAIALENPDKPDRATNSPRYVYQIEPTTLALLRTFRTPAWETNLNAYLAEQGTLSARYAKEREQNLVEVKLAPGLAIALSPGEHSQLIWAIINEFAPRYAPGSQVIYIGDTGDKWGYFDAALLTTLGVVVDAHGKMPDVVLYYAEKNWLLLVEAVTSHGPVDAKRHAELKYLFSKATAGLIYVTAFPNRKLLAHNLSRIAWETEVWVADAPSHLIHFDGERFLGPHE